MHMTRFHQHVRPRFSNPTYNSNNVGTSLGLFYTTGAQVNYRNGSIGKNYDYYDPIPQSNSYVNNPQRRVSSQRSQMQPQIKQQKISNRIQTPRQQKLIPEPKAQNYYQQPNDSRLSKFGTQSLLLPQISDRDIYQKQTKNYNIISIKPRQYNQTIKKYPKYRLEDQDANFYRKMQLENQYRDLYNREKYARKWELEQINNNNNSNNNNNNNNNNNYSQRYNHNDNTAGMKTDFEYKELHPSKLYD